MKITEKKLRRLIRSVIKEATGGFSLQGASRRYLKGVTKQGDKFTPVKSPKTKSRQSKYDHYKSLTIQHQANRPTPVSKTIIQSQPDTTRWIHPQSKVTTTLGQGETQPKKGWSYRQRTDTTVPDTTRWTHPYSKQTTTLSKGQTQPKLGWQVTPTFKGGKIVYSQGAVSDYQKAQPPKGYTKSKALSTTNPTTTQTSYATKYGQGSLSDYSTAQAGSGRDNWAVGDTTNPNVDVEVDNPAYDDYVTADAEWEQQNQDLEQSAQDAYDDWQQHTQSDTQGSMPDAPPQGGGGGQGGGPSKGGGGSGKGKGGGRGKGKGKGKGKKGKKKRKDENLNLLKQEVNEIVKSLTLINKENKKWQS